MSNVMSIHDFRESQEDNFWDVGVGADAILLATDGLQVLHMASYAKVMDYVAVTFCAKKMLADMSIALESESLSEDDKDAMIASAIESLRQSVNTIVFKILGEEDMTDEDTAQMEAEYESKIVESNEEVE